MADTLIDALENAEDYAAFEMGPPVLWCQACQILFTLQRRLGLPTIALALSSHNRARK
jgi:hypothetical protein